MKGLMRSAVWTAVIAGCLIAWWFPARVVYRVEPVNMGMRYEAEHVPSWFPDAMGLAREWLRRDRRLPPLPECVAVELAASGGRVGGLEWDRVWDAASGGGEGAPVRFFDGNKIPFGAGVSGASVVEIDQPGQYRHLRIDALEAGERGRSAAPTRVRFPLRRYWLLWSALMGCAILLPALRVGKRTRVERTSAYRGVRAGVVILVVGVALAAAPFLYGISDLFGVIVIGGFVAVVGIITAGVFASQLGVVRGMLGGRDLLASWTYGAEEWRRFVDADYVENRAAKWGIFLLVGGMCLMAGVVFFLADREAGLIVLLVMLGVVALIAVVAFAVPRAIYRRRLCEPGEVLISPRGLYINGEVHTWGMVGSAFKSVAWEAEPVPMLIFTYTYVTRYGVSEATVRVPVPQGRTEEVAGVMEAFGAEKSSRKNESGKSVDKNGDENG